VYRCGAELFAAAAELGFGSGPAACHHFGLPWPGDAAVLGALGAGRLELDAGSGAAPGRDSAPEPGQHLDRGSRLAPALLAPDLNERRMAATLVIAAALAIKPSDKV
jgi:hypothetical protein